MQKIIGIAKIDSGKLFAFLMGYSNNRTDISFSFHAGISFELIEYTITYEKESDIDRIIRYANKHYTLCFIKDKKDVEPKK